MFTAGIQAVRDPRAEEGIVAVARGQFTVQIVPQGEPVAIDGVALGRASLSKQFEGDLVGTSTGEMLSALTRVGGSAGYVAIERVSGTVGGRSGSFVLQHSGLMTRGDQSLAITLVPDSGTGELSGIAGTFAITIEGRTHSYTLNYAFPAE